jgi:hypothetical protein
VDPAGQRYDHQPTLAAGNVDQRPWRLVQDDVAEPAPGGRVGAGEVDARRLAHDTAGAVAADDVSRFDLVRPVRSGDLDTAPREPGDLVSAPDFRSRRQRVFLQQFLGPGLRQREGEGERRVEDAEVHPIGQPAEVPVRNPVPLLEKGLRDASEGEDFDRPRMDGQRFRVRITRGPGLQDDDVHPAEPQLRGQPQADRPGSDDDYLCHDFLLGH